MKLRRAFLTVMALIMTSFSTAGQAYQIYTGYSHLQNIQGFQGIAYSIADSLEQNLVQKLDRSRPILFTSFVELDNLHATTSFGRLLGEQVASRMAQYGYRIVDLKLRSGSMIIHENFGEAILSRSLHEVRTSQDAQAVIVGTYTPIRDSVIVSTKILSTLDGAMLATHDATLTVTPQIEELLSTNLSTFKPGRPGHPAGDDGPLGKGTVLLDPKNSLAARLIQTRLAELNYYKDRIDGIWGKNSRAALSRFKTERQLASPATWDVHAQRALFGGTGQ